MCWKDVLYEQNPPCLEDFIAIISKDLLAFPLHVHVILITVAVLF